MITKLVASFPFLCIEEFKAHHKTMEKKTFTISIELFIFHLSSCAKLKTLFFLECEFDKKHALRRAKRYKVYSGKHLF